MVARRKKIKRKTKRISFELGASKKQRRTYPRPSLKSILKVLALVCVFTVVGTLFYLVERYVKSAKPVKTGPLELVNVPEWVNEELEVKIFAAAGGKIFRLDEETAQLVGENLTSVAWLNKVKVRTTHNSVQAIPEFRKPLALVKRGLQKFYVDAELVVLDFVPISELPIVKINGLSVIAKLPTPGKVLQRDDLAAAVAILAWLDRMDKLVTPDKPLLYEIAQIDVSNFNGRQNKRAPHIVLYAKDDTEIIWGAEIGKWQQYLEATDEQKIAKLYGYYEEYGSLLGSVKYINLRDPQQTIPLPVDKY